jgi:hypothetical protein
VREMGQSAWLSTSSLTLQGSEGRVNAMDTGIGRNERILWSNNYSVLSLFGRGLEKARGGSHRHIVLLKPLESASQSEPARHRQDFG